jgi:hypothetical protein
VQQYSSLGLKEFHEMLCKQQEELVIISASIENINAVLQDLMSKMDSIHQVMKLLPLRTHEELEEEPSQADEPDAYDEPYDEELDQDVEDQGTAVLPSSWMEAPTPLRRTSAEPAALTGPLPLILPYSDKSQLRKHKGMKI